MMNKIRTIYLASALTLFGAPAAFSNAGPMQAPAPAPVPHCIQCGCSYAPNSGDPNTERFYNSQFYAGAQVGYEHQDSKVSGSYNTAQGEVFPFRHHSDPDGVIGELFVGKRFLFPNCVMLGFELGAAFSTNKTAHHVTLAGDRVFRVHGDRRYAVMPTVVLGYVFAPRWMLYGRFGLSYGEFETEVHDDTFPNVNLENSHRKGKWGFVPVLGIECGFSTNMSARAEIGGELYGNVKSASSNLIAPGFLTDKFRTKYSADFFNIKVGVVIKT